MKDIDSMWDPISGKWIAQVAIPKMEAEMQGKLIRILNQMLYCSVTLDLWSDRRMRSFVGITVHFINPATMKFGCNCLGVFQVKGRHTAEAIFEFFHGIMSEYGIANKVVRVVSDNAANMKKAFTLSLYQSDQAMVEEIAKDTEEGAFAEELAELEDEDEDNEADTKMEELEQSLSNAVSEMFSATNVSKYKRMGCYNHALHNTVGDGLKNAGARAKKALEKVQYFASFAHKSGAFSEALENQYGKEVTLKTDVKTRWNYQFIAAEHFLTLEAEKFDAALIQHGAKKQRVCFRCHCRT
jgi:hypothetical protein